MVATHVPRGTRNNLKMVTRILQSKQGIRQLRGALSTSIHEVFSGQGGDGSGGINGVGVSLGSLDSLFCSEITRTRGSPTSVEASERDITKNLERAPLSPPKKKTRGDLLT